MRSQKARPLPVVVLAGLLGCSTGGQDTANTSSATAIPSTSASASASSTDTGTDTDDSDGSSGTTDATSTTGSTTASSESDASTAASDSDSDATTGTSDSDTGDVNPPNLDGLTLEETFDSGILNGWVRVERWSDSNEGFIQEDRFDLDQRAHQTGQRLEFFDNNPTPHSSVFLLQYAPGWDSAQKPVPILLAHGANDQADRAWANPGESGDFGCGTSPCPETGMMQDLAARGYAVFAVTHPHSQGDNYFWSEQLYDAIQIIRDRTGADAVDLIGWSKGVMSARMYASSLTQDWGTAYAGDVRRLVLIGGPNLGFDYLFRYGTGHNSGIYADYGGKINSPGPHDELLILGQWKDRLEYGIYKSAAGDNWRGQLQMLAAWDDVYPLTASADNGLLTWPVGDSESTYYGEGEYKGLYARGKGIDFAVEQGSVIQPMIDAGIPASVETYLLCGDINLDDQEVMMKGIPNEIAGPSDGVVFIDSCAAEDGIGNLADTAILQDVNHLRLGWDATAVDQVDAWLAK
ncbi:MAG: hypothetical protein R3A79_11415 [Nannocystaceae bacterium]